MSVAGAIEATLQETGYLKRVSLGGAPRRDTAATAEALKLAITATNRRWRWVPIVVAALYIVIFLFGLVTAYWFRADFRIVSAVFSGVLFVVTLGVKALWREVVLGEILAAILPQLPGDEALRVAYEAYRYARRTATTTPMLAAGDVTKSRDAG